MKNSHFLSSVVLALSFILGFSNNALEAMQRRAAPVKPNIGIRSGKNGCYFNATMQCLTNCLPPIDANSDDISVQALIASENPFVKDLVALKTTIANRKNDGSVAANTFRNKVINANRHEFRAGLQQEDAAALLNVFLPLIQASGCGLFTLQTQSVNTRPECDHQSIVLETSLSLELPIDENVRQLSLTACLNDYSKPEHIAAKQKLRCGICNARNRNGTKQMQPRGFPKTLILQLKRFKFIDANNSEKINTPVSFPLENFVCKSVGYNNILPMDYQYALTGFVQHRGDVDGGHYTAYVKRNGQWYFCDDADAHPINEENVQRIAAQGADEDFTPYIFFYEKTGQQERMALDSDEQDDESTESSESEESSELSESEESFSDDTSQDNTPPAANRRRARNDDESSLPQAKRRQTEASKNQAKKPLYNLNDYKSALNNSKKLIGANLKGADLHGRNLEGANLRNANLTGANLDGVNLRGANLTNAIFDRANLTNADLTGAIITGTHFIGALLIQTTLSDLTIDNADFSGCHITEAILQNVQIINNANFTGATFTNLDIADMTINNANFSRATFNVVSILESELDDVDMTRIIANMLFFNNTILRNIDFINANFVRGLVIHNTPVLGPHLNFERARINDSCIVGNIILRRNHDHRTEGVKNNPPPQAVALNTPLKGACFFWSSFPALLNSIFYNHMSRSC